VLPHQHDLSARLISFFEGMGWATKVRWPNPVQIVALLQPGPVEEPMATRSVGSLRDTTPGKLEETSGRA
jgi:hypothetical protein